MTESNNYINWTTTQTGTSEKTQRLSIKEIAQLDIRQTAKVSLRGNPSTGYGWYIISRNTKVSIQLKYEPDPVPKRWVGSGGSYHVYITRLQTGPEHVHLVYKRDWEKNIAPATEFIVDL